MSENSQNLFELFVAAKSQKKALESATDTNNDSYREQVRAAVEKLEECQRLVRQLSLFSPNETVDEVATRDLQYLTVNYILAELLQRSYSADRENVLRRAVESYEKYLETLEEYELLSAGDKKLYERYMDNPSAFSLASTNDAAARRSIKVARFREEKELKQKLEYLSQNQNLLIESNDEVIRQICLAEINLYTHQTFQSLDLLFQELNMLSQIRSAVPPPDATHHDDSRRRAADQSGYSERLDGPISELMKGRRGGPLLSRDGRPLQPFTLTDKRTQIQQGVFQPGHNLPTMSIDEYLEEERRRGGIIEGGEQSGAPKEIDEDDMEKADEETMKARAWDEYTEANPRGSGNTINRG